MIEIIQTYSNQIVMIVTAITPALAAIAALIMMIRKTNSSNETMISESREMRKQSSAIRTSNEKLDRVLQRMDDLEKRDRANELEIHALRQELSKKETKDEKINP